MGFACYRSTEDGFDLAEGEDGWEAYFEALFESVTRNKLDQLKKGEGPFPPTRPFHSIQSQDVGSREELDDLKAAYDETGGSLGDIMTHIPHEDEAHFVLAISDLIAGGELAATAAWKKSSRDEKAKLVDSIVGCLFSQ